jgi:Uma2 family endonuclease
MTIQQKIYTAKEFWATADERSGDKLYELIHGEIFEMPPPKKINSIIAAYILRLLGNFVEANEIEGYVLGADGGYTLSDEDVRVPDVSFILKERLPDVEDTESIIAPDFVVEVISPSESPRMVNEKTALYLLAGAKVVWNIYPEEKEVEVWTKGVGEKFEMQAFRISDTLDGGEVLKGFSLPVKDIFKQIPKKK